MHGYGGAEADRLRAELEELTGKPVLLNMLVEPSPQEGPGDAGPGRAGGEGPGPARVRGVRRGVVSAVDRPGVSPRSR